MHGHDRTALESGTMAGEDTLNWQSNSETNVDTSYVGPAVRGSVNLLSLRLRTKCPDTHCTGPWTEPIAKSGSEQ